MSSAARGSKLTTEEILASIHGMLNQGGESADEGGTSASVDAETLIGTDEIERSSDQMSSRTMPQNAVAPYAQSPRAVEELQAVAEKSALTRDDSRPFISEDATTASVAALSELMDEISSDSGGAAASHYDRAIENVTHELLMRFVRAWVDTKLPSLVEDIVRREIRRIVWAAKAPVTTRNGLRDGLPRD